MAIPPAFSLAEVPTRWVAILLFGAGALYFVALAVYRVFFHPLRHFPGPILNKITEYPFVLAGIKGEYPFYAESLFKRYGPVVRLGPNNLGFIDAGAWRDIYGTRYKDQIEKAYEYYRETETGPISMVNAGPDEHARLRKWVAPRFSDRSIKEQEPMIKGYVDLLVRRLHEHCHDGQAAVDLRDWYNFCTFDILGKFAFSSDFGCLESSKYHPWVHLVVFQQKEIEWITEMNRQGLRFITSIIMRLLAKHKLEFRGYTIQKLNARIQSGKQKDIMEDLLNNKDGVKLDMERLLQNSTLFIAAGSETTATVLTATTYFLLTHPDAYAKVAAEVRSTFKHPADITVTAVNQLPYMLACLNEATRLFPVVPAWLPRRLVKGDAVISGHAVPEGTVMATWSWAMYHDERNFALPLEYHPERFMADGDPRFAADKLEALQAFSCGTRDCVGRNLAYAEMRLILANVLLSFDLTLAPDSRAWTEGQKAYIIWQKPPMNVYLKPRV